MAEQRVNLDDIDRRMVQASEGGYSSLWDGICCDLIAEVRRLRKPHDAILDAAREVARLCHLGSNEIDFDYVSTIAKNALGRLAEILDDDEPATDDPWTIHGEGQAILRADGERSPR